MGINIPIIKDIHKRLSVYFQLFMIYGYKHVKDSDYNEAGRLRAQQQQRRAQCSMLRMRVATESPHSARTDLPIM